MKKQKIEAGDLVRFWGDHIGIVRWIKAWYLGKNFIEVNKCVVHRRDVKLIRKGFLPRKFLRYLRAVD